MDVRRRSRTCRDGRGPERRRDKETGRYEQDILDTCMKFVRTKNKKKKQNQKETPY